MKKLYAALIIGVSVFGLTGILASFVLNNNSANKLSVMLFFVCGLALGYTIGKWRTKSEFNGQTMTLGVAIGLTPFFIELINFVF